MSMRDHQEKIKASLLVSRREGMAASSMQGIIDYYLTPFALSLGASAQQIGFLVSVPNLIASIFQLYAVRVVDWAGSRLRFLVGATALQATLFIPLSLLAVLPIPSPVFWLIVLTIIFRIFANLIATAWGSLVSDYLPENRRGRYFGSRNRLLQVALVISVALGGVWLFQMKSVSVAVGFLVLFLVAAISRFVSCFLMAQMVDLNTKKDTQGDFTFWMFLRRFRESNFVKFALFVSCILFATHLAAPFFSVYMLRDLHFNYLQYMLILLMEALSGMVSFPIWGRHADVVGNARVLKTTSFLIPLIPFFWLFSKNYIYLAVVEIFAGFVWGGFNLCATNFIYDAVSPEKRVRCLGYFNLMNGVAIFLGALCGGLLLNYLPPFLGFPVLTLFVISIVLRIAAHFLLSRQFKEVRQSARHIKSTQLFFSVLGIRPIVDLDTVD
jgi:MFS family permease